MLVNPSTYCYSSLHDANVSITLNFVATILQKIKAGNRVTRFLHLTCQKPPRQKLLTKEPRAKSEQPRAKSEERRAKIEERRGKSQKRRAKSEEQRAKSEERRAKSEEPRAKSEERSAKREERRRKSQEPRATSQERRAKSEEPDCDFKRTAVILKYGDVENIATLRCFWGNNDSETYKYRGNKLYLYLRKQIFYTRYGTEPSNDPQIIENIPL